MRLLSNIFVVDPLPLLSDCPSPRVDLKRSERPPHAILKPYLWGFFVVTVFATRADAEWSVIGFEAEGFRAKIYRTASWPIEEDANAQDNHHSRHTWEVNVSGR